MKSKKNNPHYTDLEVVNNEYSDREYEINISIPEFNCLCPKSGLPDFANIKIQYISKPRYTTFLIMTATIHYLGLCIRQ